MDWTPEQRTILDHPLDAHAVVRAAPGSGKTTTLVGRVERLCALGVAPAAIRVVMFNKSIQETFVARLAKVGVRGVRVTTFDALGLEVLRAANDRRLLRSPLRVVPDGTTQWARDVYPAFRDAFDSPDEIAGAVTFWKAHLVAPKRAAFPSNPALVEAYRRFEERRLNVGDGPDELRVAFEDMVYTAVGVLRAHPGLLGRVDHVLVDEFQDVNPARVELLRRLVHPATSVMAVGDEDQGINEWCGAHPRFIRDFGASFPDLPVRTYPLSRSFRFGPTLAHAANQLIRHNAGRSPGEVVGGGPTAGEVRLTPDGADTVKELLAKGVAPADIAVLYRGRTQGAAVLAALVSDRVPMRTDDLDLLRRGRGPELALAYLHFATSDAPVRMEEVWPVVFAPDRYIQKEAFAAQVRRRGAKGLRAVLRDQALAEELGQSRKARASMADLARLLDAMQRAKTAGEALDRLLEVVEIEDQLRARLRAERDQETAIASFHAVHALLAGLGVPPGEAATALAEVDANAGEPPDRCVWVSTIHKAKGLEWRHVVLPGLIEGACPAERRGEVAGTVEEPDGVPQSPWMEEERRIFYVGLTRASEVAWLHAPGDAPSRFVDEALGRTAVAARGIGIRAIVAAVTRGHGQKPPAQGKPWKPEDDDALQDAWDAGETLKQLAERFGRSRSGVAARLVRLGVVDSREEARERG